MPTWLRVPVYFLILLFCTVFGGGIGAWLPARGTEGDTGAAGVADGMQMIMFGTLGLFVGFFIGLLSIFILKPHLDKTSSVTAKYADPPGEDVWPPPPRQPE